MNAILILLLIGALAGTWLISGVVPAMIYYGLQILNPTIFSLRSLYYLRSGFIGNRFFLEYGSHGRHRPARYRTGYGT